MIILASKSPRREALLKQIEIEFKTLSFEIDESIILGETPKIYVQRMAKQKALKAASLTDEKLPILAADTVVSWQDQVFQKPQSYDEYAFGLRRLSNRSHHVYSAIALKKDDQLIIKLQENTVTFGNIPEHFIEHYWNTGKPKDKAGGYGIQGLMAQFISKIEGSYSGIMGLPLFELSQALNEIGYYQRLK